MDEFETYLAGVPTLDRVIPIAETRFVAAGGRTVIGSLEIWSDRLVLHYTLAGQGITPPDLPTQETQDEFMKGLTWNARDDLGTTYQLCGGGGGGDDRLQNHSLMLRPAPPAEATIIRFDVPADESGAPLEVGL